MAILQPADFHIDPATTDGNDLAAILNRLYDALISRHSHASRPDYLEAGAIWAKTVNGGIELYFYDGSDDQLIVSRVNSKTTYPFPKIHVLNADPDNSLGDDGDIALVVS